MSRAQLTSTVEQNTGGAVVPVVAGKNLAINGLQEIWQRGTSFSGAGIYTSDRWYSGNASTTYAQETSVVPTGIRYAMKMTTSTTGVAPTIWQAVETANAIQFAGQTVTLSFYARSTDAVAAYVRLDYSTTADTAIGGSYTSIAAATPATTSTGYTRVSAQFAIPSNALTLRLIIGAGANLSNGGSFYITGIQLEAGSVMTPISRSGGTLQGELALCQRYYWRNSNTTGGTQSFGLGRATTSADLIVLNPVPMRTNAASIEYGGTMYVTDPNIANYSVTGLSIRANNTYANTVSATVASGLSQGKTYTYEYGGGGNTSYMGFSAEL